jgi:hypothetical protein
VWAPWVRKACTIGVGEKKIIVLAELLPKLQLFLWSFYLFGHHTTLQVVPT